MLFNLQSSTSGPGAGGAGVGGEGAGGLAPPPSFDDLINALLSTDQADALTRIAYPDLVGLLKATSVPVVVVTLTLTMTL